MGAVCCVAAKDKTLQSASPSEIIHRNIRYSPTWNFRWDNRGRVAGEDTAVTWFSNGISRNDGLENKNELSYASDDGSPLQNYQRNRCQKAAVIEGTARNLINSPSGKFNQINSLASIIIHIPTRVGLFRIGILSVISYSLHLLFDEKNEEPIN